MDMAPKLVDLATMLTSPPDWLVRFLTFDTPLCVIVCPGEDGYEVEVITHKSRVSTQQWHPLDAADAIRRATKQFGTVKLQVLYLRGRERSRGKSLGCGPFSGASPI